MLFPVTIYDAKGRVRKVLSSKKLHERHWKNFRDQEERSSVTKGRRPERPKGLKERLDREFAETPTHYCQ
jgi:hypothetical protein